VVSAHRLRRRLPGAALVAALALPATGAAFDWPQLSLSEPETKRFTLIRRYAYRERRYDPPHRVPLMDTPGARYSSPEAVVVAQVSARAALDFDWWLSTWERETQARLLEEEPDPQRWVERWQRAGTPGALELVRWIEVGQRVVVSWRAAGESDAASVEEHARLLRLEGGSWVAAHPEPNFPAARTWIGGGRVERTVR